MKLKEILYRITHTMDGEIQRAYEAYDRASEILDARDKNPNFDRQKELEELVREAERLAKELLEKYEGKKNWPGVFREMHMNLARIFLRTGRFDEAYKECEKVAGYNPVDAEELREAINTAVSGKKIDSIQLDEVGIG